MKKNGESGMSCWRSHQQRRKGNNWVVGGDTNNWFAFKTVVPLIAQNLHSF